MPSAMHILKQKIMLKVTRSSYLLPSACATGLPNQEDDDIEILSLECRLSAARVVPRDTNCQGVKRQCHQVA